MSNKIRLDLWLTKHGMAPSRQRAQALVLAGCVTVNDTPAKSAAQLISDDDHVSVREKDHPYVSRGGVKLAHALDHFAISVSEKIAVDVGASTGGFTDCLLQHGAKKVYAVDVGYGQLDWQLRNDKRVVCIERCNARSWQAVEVTETIDMITIDVSFISVKKILPNLLEHLSLAEQAVLIVLIKPQFEVGRAEADKAQGVIRDVKQQERVVSEITTFVSQHNFHVIGVEPAPIKGPKGNQEYLLVARKLGCA